MARRRFLSFDEAEKSILDILEALQDHPPADSSGFVIPIRDVEDALSDMGDIIGRKDKEIAELEDKIGQLEDRVNDLEYEGRQLS